MSNHTLSLKAESHRLQVKTREGREDGALGENCVEPHKTLTDILSKNKQTKH